MRRYGNRKKGVAVAATANTLSLRGAVRTASRALGYTPSEIDELARNVPHRIRDRDRESGARDRTSNHTSEWDTALSSPAMRGHPLQGPPPLRPCSWSLPQSSKASFRGPVPTSGASSSLQRGMKLSEVVPLEASGTPGTDPHPVRQGRPGVGACGCRS